MTLSYERFYVVDGSDYHKKKMEEFTSRDDIEIRSVNVVAGGHDNAISIIIIYRTRMVSTEPEVIKRAQVTIRTP